MDVFVKCTQILKAYRLKNTCNTRLRMARKKLERKSVEHVFTN